MAKTVATIMGIVFLLVGIAGFVAPGVGGFHLSTATISSISFRARLLSTSAWPEL